MIARREPIRSIVILGAGLVGLSAAIAFARHLPGIGVLLVETPADPAALADRLPAILPTGLPFLDRLGFDADLLVAAGAATHRLGTRYVGWRHGRGDAVHVFGDLAGEGAAAALRRDWLAVARHGTVAPFHRHLFAGALAERERVVPGADPRDDLAPAAAFALRLDPRVAQPLFLGAAAQLGVRLARGSIVGADRRPDGRIGAVLLDGDRRASADLFVDATGPGATLLALMADEEFDDWSALLPVDRLRLEECAPAAPSPLDRVERTDRGWRATWPFGDRHLIGHGGTTGGGLVIRPGRRRRPWCRNVLALGDAAATAGALEWTGLPLAHAALDLALEVLPGRDMHPLELAEYNRRFAMRADRVRDFVALPELRGIPPVENLAALPRSLDRTLAQFARRGLLPHNEEESFEPQSWLSLLLGLGIIPERPAPMTLDGEPDARLAAIAARMTVLADRASPYPLLLRRLREHRA